MSEYNKEYIIITKYIAWERLSSKKTIVLVSTTLFILVNRHARSRWEGPEKLKLNKFP